MARGAVAAAKRRNLISVIAPRARRDAAAIRLPKWADPIRAAAVLPACVVHAACARLDATTVAIGTRWIAYLAAPLHVGVIPSWAARLAVAHPTRSTRVEWDQVGA